jgi:DNA-binding winged helix-turn-helix (wHTH) protein/Tol biopolymer transport system component
MNENAQTIYEFGPFRLDPAQQILLRDGLLVPLQPKAFKTLCVLVENNRRVVLKDDIIKAVWEDTFVEESNLTQNIFVLRKTLGHSGSDRRYIITVHGRGYRFAEQVRAVPPATLILAEPLPTPVPPHGNGNGDRPANGNGHHSATTVLDEPSVTLPPPAPSTPFNRRKEDRRPATVAELSRHRWLIRVTWLCAAAAVILGSLLFRPSIPSPRVTHIRQLTHIGTVLFNQHLITDGPRVYIGEWKDQQRALAYVSPEGAEDLIIPKAIPQLDVDDISPNGSELLGVDLADANIKGLHKLWRVPVGPGSPRSIGGLLARDSRWSADGSTIAYTVDDELHLVNSDGSNSRKLATLPGMIFYPQWAPDGRSLRFSVVDPHVEGMSLWQADLKRNTVAPLLPDWPSSRRTQAGHFTPDGRYFFFTALSDDGTRDVWAIRSPSTSWRRVNTRPVRITAGPMSYYRPTPSRDGKSLFVVGAQAHGEVLRYASSSHQFVPYLLGASADHLAFSRDGQWVAYVQYPQAVLFRSRIDGSDRRQLTFSPMRVFHPQWSPDGTLLAFQASANSAAPMKIYTVPRDSGQPVLATPKRTDWQLYPSWLPGGQSLLFSASDTADSTPALYLVDLKTGVVSSLPETSGLYWGQISPDGHSVVALTETTQKLILYDTVSHQRRQIAPLADYPFWSNDGRYVFFSTLFWRRPDAGIFRWHPSTTPNSPDKIDKILDLPNFLLGGVWGVWFALTPDGDPLILRDLTTTDLYAIDLDLP